jgi:N-acetylglucosamine malate deacetylase 1
MTTVCFFSPHPDDIELFCGGTLLDHEQRNDQLFIIMMTKGGKGTINPFTSEEKLEKIREKEAIQRYDLVKNLKLIFMDFKDGEVKVNDESIIIIQSLLNQINPTLIYIPEYLFNWVTWKHSDHINTGAMVSKAVDTLSSTTIRCYHSSKVNRIIMIDSYYEKNNEAIKFYKSQYGVFGPELFFLNRFVKLCNKQRKHLGEQNGCRYAEGFREFQSNEILFKLN